MTKTKKPKAVYSFRPGFRTTGLNAAAVAAELERLRNANLGQLTPEVVLDRASDPESPLHGAFTWDDTDAAREYRLYQARTLCRSVIVTYPDMAPRHVYVHVQAEPGSDAPGGYHRMVDVVGTPVLLARAMDGLQHHLAGALKAVNEVRELEKAASPTRRTKQVEAIGDLVEAAAKAAREVR